jgi:chemotaxis protein MotC
LVEETALRREVFSLSEGDDLNKFLLLSSQYLRRFQNSVYADNFKQRFSAVVTRLGLTSEPQKFAKIAKAIGDLETDDQVHLYMLIAQAAILDGNAMVARLSAEKVTQVAKDGSPDGMRAKLYESAALILTDNYDKGFGKLKELDVSRLSKRDAELRGAILSIAKQIRQWPETPGSPDDVEPKPNPQAPGRDGTATAAAGPVIDLAQKAISDTDQLLQEHVH